MAIIPDFSLIKNGNQFENLVEDYFNAYKKKLGSGSRISEIGGPTIGPDGGVDIMLKYKYDDGIYEQEWSWVIQCKQSKSIIGLPAIAGINIPSVVHGQAAVGYLLICSSGVSSKLKDQFDLLNLKCRFKYKYLYWTGSEFETKIIELGDDSLMRKYFKKKRRK